MHTLVAVNLLALAAAAASPEFDSGAATAGWQVRLEGDRVKISGRRN